MQGSMLESIVHHDAINLGMARQFSTKHSDSIASDKDGHVGVGVPVFQDFVGLPARSSPVTTGQNSGVRTHGGQVFKNPSHHRCLAGTAHREISNRDDRSIDSGDATPPIETPIAPLNGSGVEPRSR